MATIVTELEAALASVTRLTGERDEFSAKLAECLKLNESLRSEKDALAKAHADALKISSDALEAEKTAHNATKVDLEAKTRALANPAFAAAAATGDKAAVKEGGSEAGSVMTKDEARAELKKITDPRLRSQYRIDHKVELGL